MCVKDAVHIACYEHKVSFQLVTALHTYIWGNTSSNMVVQCKLQEILTGTGKQNEKAVYGLLVQPVPFVLVEQTSFRMLISER